MPSLEEVEEVINTLSEYGTIPGTPNLINSMSAICVFLTCLKKICSLTSKLISAEQNIEGTSPIVCQLFEIAPFLIEIAFKKYALNTSQFSLILKPSLLIAFVNVF